MKLSRKICDCAQSPIRKFYPYAVAAQQRGIRIHQLNIGQPDIQTPPAFFEAIEAGRRDVLAYAESPGIPALLEAIRAYYARIGASFETQDILVTTGGSEALLMAMLCILDEGDEVLIPEPYYPNYFTFIRMAGGPGASHPDLAGGRLPLRRARPHRAAHHGKDARHSALEPRQPHRHGAHPGGAAPHGGYRPRARPVSHLRRGLPRIYL